MRVEAGRLRSRLREYYDTEGREDRVLIELPKGGYLPAFTFREEEAAKEKEALPVVVQQVPEPVPVRARRAWAGWVLAVLLLVGLMAGVGWRWHAARKQAAPGGHAGEPIAVAVLPFANETSDKGTTTWRMG